MEQIIVEVDSDKIECDGKKIKPQRYEYYKMNKPRFYITSMSKSENNRKTIVELLPKSKTKLFPIGRLDYDTEGLLLFTNDGLMAHHVAHPSFKVTKKYLAYIEGSITQSIISKMRKGAKMKERFLVPTKIILKKVDKNDSLVEIEIPTKLACTALIESVSVSTAITPHLMHSSIIFCKSDNLVMRL